MKSSEPDYFMEAFQLESLIDQQVSFIFLNLNHQPTDLSPQKLELILSRAERVQKEDIETYIFNHAEDFFHPVVLLCEDGQLSSKIAEQLSLKYKNAYALKGGLKALIAHFRE